MTVVSALLRLVAVVAVALGVSLAGAGIAAAAPAAPAAANEVQAVTMRPAQIQFQWVNGQQQWAQPSLNRLWRTVFQARADGSFVMAQPDGFPTVVGRLSGDGTFEGEWANSVGNTGSTAVHISGRISTDQSGPVQMSLVYEAGSVTVAHVDNQQFGANASKVFRAQMQMQAA
jgi:hypothetical protein